MKQFDEKIPEYWKNLSLENIIYLNDEEKECVEEWRDIKGYEGLYMVSDCGRVKSLRRLSYPNRKGSKRPIPEKIKPSFEDGKGYRRIEISRKGINRKIFVHRLVAEAFLPNPKNKPQINHLFGNKSDNRVNKIDWATKSEDRRHAIKVLNAGTGRPWKNCKPEDHPMFGKRGKLAPNSRPIICNETGVKYECIRDASKQLKIAETTLKYVLMGLTKKSKIGYTFNYLK